MVRLIVSDVDGTLVEDGTTNINPELYGVIRKLREQGVQFAVASGRQWVSIEKLFDPIKEKIFYISDNGAYVGCHGRNLFLNTLDIGLAQELIADVKQYGDLKLMVSGPDYVYMERTDQELVDWMVNGYRYEVRLVDDIASVTAPIIKVSIYREADVEGRAAGLLSKYGGRMKMAVAGDMWLDCMATGVNKGQAVGLLQESLRIAPEQTMAFGDQLNDLEMLGQAYYSFAVGNARQEVRQAARFQADTNRNDGVLKVLKTLL